MKTLSIDTLAIWFGTISTFQDGDIFRESNIDLHSADIADRLGWLKAGVDSKPALADNNTWSGDQTFDGDVVINDTLQFGTALSGYGVIHREFELPDSNSTHAPTWDTARVGTITGNRSYGFNNAGAGRRITLIRHRAADAFSVTFADSLTNTIGVVPASQAGFIICECNPLKTPFWRPVAWSSNITSLATT